MEGKYSKIIEIEGSIYIISKEKYGTYITSKNIDKEIEKIKLKYPQVDLNFVKEDFLMEYDMLIEEKIILLSGDIIYQKINEWIYQYSESFFDYFCHDNVKDSSWAFFLLGKGYKKHSNRIINEILDDNDCIDQETLYHVYPEENLYGVVDNTAQDKNLKLVAEFLASTPFYREKASSWLNEELQIKGIEIMTLLSVNGVKTTINIDENNEIYLDLNTAAKSHLYLYSNGLLKGRYDDTNIDDEDLLLKQLCYQFKESLWGRNYGNYDWYQLCEKIL